MLEGKTYLLHGAGYSLEVDSYSAC